MNEEIDEFDVYHQDFTTASDWEVFIARIEEVLSEWNLAKSNITNHAQFKNKWIKKFEEFEFLGIKFTLSYHTKAHVDDTSGTFIKKSNITLDEIYSGIWKGTDSFIDDEDGSPYPVSNWFGLNRYLMMYPNKALLDGSLIKLIMSSVNTAFANTDCGVPFFVKIREHWQPTYLGLYEDSHFRTSFDTIHLKRISSQCSHLSGLVGLFKTKIASPVALDAVLASAKFSYELKEYDAFAWKKVTLSNEFLSIDGFDVKKLTELPFGCEKNPLQSALLNTIWPKFRESTIIDSSSYSELDPLMAPTWTITLKMKNDVNFQLSDTIGKMMDLMYNEQLLMNTLGLSRSLGIVNPLHKITEAPITISKLMKAAIGQGTNKTEFKGPIADELLMPLLYFMFPDAVEDTEFLYPELLPIEYKQSDSKDPKLCSYVKTSPTGGLVWRLSVTAARLHDAGGLPYLAHLWYEFIQELQYRWEHRIIVPGVAEGSPNARTCLLHQKMQLLNCCIRRASQNNTTVASNSSEDEFYDCSDSESEKHPPWDQPEGRLNRLENASLKNGTPLYVPITQDPAPKTEDQLEEDAELMVRLGNNAKASELRAKMMSASLLSDMEAFKAANPGSELCDFVQWYSPRDWKPDDGGSLGDRMLLPGNPWMEAWSVARPVPAARQRRLFDETRVAEQLLHYLRSRTVSAVAELLLPAVLRAGAEKAHTEGVSVTSSTVGGVDSRRTFEIAARELHEAEKEACRCLSARTILGNGVSGEALDVDGRSRILSAVGGSLPKPTRREFTLKVKDEVAPQVMRAAISNDMLLIGAFTERIVCL